MSADGDQRSLERRVDELCETVRDLAQRLDRLESRLQPAAVSRPAEPPGETATAHIASVGEGAGEAGRGWTWGNTSTVLSRAATVCFLLVAALVLRTLVDSGALPTRMGSWMGVGYASLLLATGWSLTGRRSGALASVFSVSGMLLLCTVVLEAHARYGALSSPASYAALALAGLGTALVGRATRVALPAGVATLAVLATGPLIDFPTPSFPHLAALVLVANVMAYLASRVGRCTWLRVVALMITVGLWAVWSIEAYELATVPESVGHLSWFAPLLAAFVLFYVGTAYLEANRRGDAGASWLDAALPTLTAAWAHAAAVLGVGAPRVESKVWLGFAEVALAATAFALAWLLSRKGREGAPGTNTFVLAACCWLGLALPLASGSGALSAAALAAVGLGVGVVSKRWASGGVRFTSYLVQMVSCLGAVWTGAFAVGGPNWPLRSAAAGVSGAIAFLHYRWCRAHPPPSGSAFFTRVDKTDDGAVVLLLLALVAGFLMLRLWVYELLGPIAADRANAFACAQSIVINLSALALIFVAFGKRNAEVRGVAILVIVIGAVKVFVSDLLGAEGLPLVLSVLSFGVAAALGAVILGRWSRGERQEGAASAGSHQGTPP